MQSVPYALTLDNTGQHALAAAIEANGGGEIAEVMNPSILFEKLLAVIGQAHQVHPVVVSELFAQLRQLGGMTLPEIAKGVFAIPANVMFDGGLMVDSVEAVLVRDWLDDIAQVGDYCISPRLGIIYETTGNGQLFKIVYLTPLAMIRQSHTIGEVVTLQLDELVQPVSRCPN